MKQAALQADRKTIPQDLAIHHHPDFCPQQCEVWPFPHCPMKTLFTHICSGREHLICQQLCIINLLSCFNSHQWTLQHQKTETFLHSQIQNLVNSDEASQGGLSWGKTTFLGPE